MVFYEYDMLLAIHRQWSRKTTSDTTVMPYVEPPSPGIKRPRWVRAQRKRLPLGMK